MAGVDCWELFTLLTMFFGHGTEFQEDPFNYLDGAPKIRPPLDITDTDSDEDASVVEPPVVTKPPVEATTSHAEVSGSSSTLVPPVWEPQVKSHSKTTYMDKVTDISMAQGFLPKSKDSLHNTGIPDTYTVRRSGTSGKGRSLYMCPFGNQCSSPPYVSDIASTGSHVHQHHLGHCIQCSYDGSHFYNGTGWKDHMSSKHEGVRWYRSQLGVISNLPTSFFKVATPAVVPSSTISGVSDPSATQPGDPPGTNAPTSLAETLDIPVSDTLEFVPDAEEEPIDDPDEESEPPTARQGIDIDSLTVADLKEITRFSPSDLHQYRYFGGGSWLGRHHLDNSKTHFFAAELASEYQDVDLPAPEEGEDRLVPKKRKHEMHLFPKERHGKIWRAADPEDDPNGGLSTV